MSNLQELLQSYSDIEMRKWEQHEGLVTVPIQNLPDVLSSLLAMTPRPLWLTHVVNDERQLGEGFALYVVLHFPEEDFSLTLSSKGINDEFPSLTPVFPALNWSEREVQDLFGLTAVGHPDPRPLVLHPGWPKGFNPLRKDRSDQETRDQIKEERKAFQPLALEVPPAHGEGVFEIPVGPIHAGIIEPGHFRFHTVGEVILHLEAQLFYTHKGVEKLLEGQSIEAGLEIIERVCGVCTVSHALAYCEAVEKLASMELPRHILLWRTALTELERIYNHIGDIGNLCAGVGFALGNANGLQCKEKLQRLNREFFGHRFLRGTVIPGGVKSIPEPDGAERLMNQLIKCAKDFEEWIPLLLAHDGFRQRAVTTGVLRRVSAVDLGVTGPAARASGVANDWRETHAHLLYPELHVQARVETDGDVWSRLLVRVRETRDSFRMIFALLQEAIYRAGDMTENVISVPYAQMSPWQPAWGCVESPRGTDVIWLMVDAERKIFRCRIRSASYANWPAVPLAVLGNIVPDFPLINKSFELCYSCCDR